MTSYTLDGRAPGLAPWSFVDRGYLTHCLACMTADGQRQGAEGEQFGAGRKRIYTIVQDLT